MRVINCTCGYVVQGESDEDLLTNARAHIADAHPDLAGQVKDEDLLAQAVEIA